MLSVHGRKPASVVIEPVARTLHKAGVSPNVVTVAGTAIAIVFALWLIPTGHHFAAAVLIGLTVATDMVDGTMARMRGGGTKFGATLDATCDRLSDGAVFGALAFWCALQQPQEMVLMALSLVILVASQVTSYVKARAEASGIKVVGGLIERPERLIIGLVAVGLHGLGIPHILAWGLWILAAGSVYTVIERLVIVARSEVGTEHIAAPEGAREFSQPEDGADR
ncbi:CDP-alcohol phosphatidyltransferase family protein [Corynebacterium falsenii]|uniref:phosphatidylinositol phosphate synthase n=1 Tax=Corynebacterium falsenii TaxID=108486 RepID=UPI001CCECC6D|nr:CDP-alcohol phosphatidyltransferase family protein [Corynebacterium falsenii]UBI06076.1 CDP-alcohol phosphatidyltransferase family protein [Corynebacterium falsenii]